MMVPTTVKRQMHARTLFRSTTNALATSSLLPFAQYANGAYALSLKCFSVLEHRMLVIHENEPYMNTTRFYVCLVSSVWAELISQNIELWVAILRFCERVHDAKNYAKQQHIAPSQLECRSLQTVL